MIDAVLDTNVVLQSLISRPDARSRQVVEAGFDRRFKPLFSEATVDELLHVLSLMKSRHNLGDDEILAFIEALLERGDYYTRVSPAPTNPVRDLTDRKFLDLAEGASADYLVTNDRRHLLPLKTFGLTQIVTPAAFLRALDA